MQKYLSCCGLYCGACSSMMLQEKAEGDPSVANFQYEYAEEPCEGCSQDSLCQIVTCCEIHDVVTCAFCVEFPCEGIRNFSRDEWPHHKEVLDNLTRMRQIGIEAWLEEMRKTWSCPRCGARTHWYQSKCPACEASWDPKYV